MKVLGRDYTREELLRRSNPSAIYGTRRLELSDGRGRGQRIIEVKTSAGLRASLSVDRCLDILDLEYKGINISFLSKNGVVSAALTSPDTDSFPNYWPGGFLYTCGLRNTGPSCNINGEFFPTHGRIGVTPAESVSVSTNEDLITISGKVRETALFGPNLEMERKISLPSDGAKITVKDIISNLTPEAENVLFLYHINFGFPFLSEDIELEFPESDIRGRTDLAQKNMENRLKITPPIDGEPELVFFYQPKEKDVNVSLSNRRLGIKAVLSYDSLKLPVLSQWKCMRSGDYALGIEPGTSFLRGRKEELKNGYDIRLPGFGHLEYGFTITLNDANS